MWFRLAWRTILSERRFSYWYHGTDGINLHSILKNGMQSDPKQRVWSDKYPEDLSSAIEGKEWLDVDKLFGSRCRDVVPKASLPGIYFSDRFSTAHFAGNNALRTRYVESGIPTANCIESPVTVVMARLEESTPSITMDEDEVKFSIESVVMPLVNRLHYDRSINSFERVVKDIDRDELAKSALDLFIQLRSRHEPKVELSGEEYGIALGLTRGVIDAIMSLNEVMVIVYDLHDQQKRLKDLRENEEGKILSLIEYLEKEDRYGTMDSVKKSLEELPQYIESVEDRVNYLSRRYEEIGGMQSADVKWKSAMHRLLVVLRRFSKTKDTFQNNIRVTEPLGYRGSNKIVLVATCRQEGYHQFWGIDYCSDEEAKNKFLHDLEETGDYFTVRDKGRVIFEQRRK